MLQLTLVCLLTKGFGVLSTAATLFAVEITVLLWRFHVGNGLISLAGNTVLMYCLVEWLKAPVLPTAIAAIILCSLANFLIADRWVFHH